MTAALETVVVVIIIIKDLPPQKMLKGYDQRYQLIFNNQ